MHGCDVQDQRQDSTTKVRKINTMAGAYTQGLQGSPDQDCVYGQSGPKVGVRPARLLMYSRASIPQYSASTAPYC